MVVAAGNDAWRSLGLRASPLAGLSRGRKAGWLVIAPHPDDETLGAGGLVARLAAEGNPAWIVFLTAGEASHTGAPHWPAARIARTRREEARQALSALGQPPGRAIHLGWPDGDPPSCESPAFRMSVERLAGLCRRHRIGAIATTWRGEAHCDHQAAFHLAAAVAAHAPVRLFEYLVWGWRDLHLLTKLRDFRAFRLDAGRSRAARQAAIARHRTQAGPMIRDAAEAFRLPADIAALATRDRAILVTRGNHAA